MNFSRSNLLILSVLTAVYFCVYTAVHLGSKTVSAEIFPNQPTVLIDAGHGGEDGGAVSVTNVLESDINLAVAKRMEHLMVFCGVNTVMTRKDAQALSTQGDTIRERKISDLKNRVALIGEYDHGILVSIHQNHFPQSQYSGPQVLYADTHGSKDLAVLVQERLCDAAKSPVHREIKKAESVYLLNNIRCTAILVECGFLSNPREESLLRQDEYQKKLICAISGAVLQHLEEGNEDVEI